MTLRDDMIESIGRIARPERDMLYRYFLTVLL